MLIQIAKRVIRAPMSEGALLKVAQSLIVNPPLSDENRAILTTRKYSDGRSFQEGWRSEMRNHIERIAAEKTWLLQRQQLLHLRVAAASWIALYNAVGVERRISLWRTYV
jgi:predicted Ser/Thr protein kinase